MIQDCEQLRIDNGWALDRMNACHIGNTNEETGLVWKEMESIKLTINTIQTFQGINMAIWATIGCAVLALVIKKMWGK